MRPGAVGCLRRGWCRLSGKLPEAEGSREDRSGRGWEEPLCWGPGAIADGALGGAARSSVGGSLVVPPWAGGGWDISVLCITVPPSPGTS